MTTVAEVMTPIVLTADPGTTIGEAASLMAQRRVGSILVLVHGQLVGIFTERDILRALSQDSSAHEEAIEHWMTRDPQTILPGARIEDALQRMVEGHFRHLPVVDGAKLVGMLSMRDVSRHQLSQEETSGGRAAGN